MKLGMCVDSVGGWKQREQGKVESETSGAAVEEDSNQDTKKTQGRHQSEKTTGMRM